MQPQTQSTATVSQDQQKHRLAYTRGQIEAQLAGLGQHIARGEPVVLISDTALYEAQALYIGLIRQQRESLTEDCQNLVGLAKNALVRLRFSKNQIEEIALRGEPLDPVGWDCDRRPRGRPHVRTLGAALRDIRSADP
jgi:hypothetical protein